MKTQDPSVIAEEVRQLCAQYLREVPSSRRTWPKSIKDRIFQLFELELSSAAIAAQTGVPIATIYSWKSVLIKSQTFLPMKVVPNKGIERRSKPTTVVTKKEPERQCRGDVPTITVVALTGIRFEGLDVSTALQIAAKLGLGL
ncbi:hypothetical protein WDW86_04545 [Bdellovibrionota bacterium FG-2]